MQVDGSKKASLIGQREVLLKAKKVADQVRKREKKKMRSKQTCETNSRFYTNVFKLTNGQCHFGRQIALSRSEK